MSCSSSAKDFAGTTLRRISHAHAVRRLFFNDGDFPAAARAARAAVDIERHNLEAWELLMARGSGWACRRRG